MDTLLQTGEPKPQTRQPQLDDGEELGIRGKPIDKKKGKFARKILEEQVSKGKGR